MDNDFYLVLPSNSSMTYFPDNTTTCFTTQLCREIRLIGQWTVGLAEIHIPCTIAHLQKSDAKISFNPDAGLGTKGISYSIPHGLYENVEQIAAFIVSAGDIGKHYRLEAHKFHKGYYELKRVCSCSKTHRLTFTDKISRIFGFDDPAHKTGLTEKDVLAARPACLARAIPDQLYVYTDICEPRLVGDTQAPLLRIVAQDNAKYKFGTNSVKHFAPIHYIPLLHHSFRDIVIDIRDQHGHPIPFEYGTLTVALHFRREQ